MTARISVLLTAFALTGCSAAPDSDDPLTPAATPSDTADWLSELDASERAQVMDVFTDFLADASTQDGEPVDAAQVRIAMRDFEESLVEVVGVEQAETFPGWSEERQNAVAWRHSVLSNPDRFGDTPMVYDEAHHDHDHAPPPFSTIGGTMGTDLTWCLDTASTDVTRLSQIRALRRSVRTWAREIPVRFTGTTNCGTADIVFSWETGAHGDGTPFVNPANPNVLAHAFGPSTTLAGEVHFDDFETWTHAPQATGGNPVHIQTVATHELGHTLGLGHSTVASAVMFASYGGTNSQLAVDDVDGIQSLYGTDACDDTLVFMDLARSAVIFAEAFSDSAATADPFAIQAAPAFDVALVTVNGMMSNADETAIQGAGAAQAGAVAFSAIGAKSEIDTAVSFSNNSSVNFGNTYSTLARNFGQVGSTAMSDARASALACSVL